MRSSLLLPSSFPSFLPSCIGLTSIIPTSTPTPTPTSTQNLRPPRSPRPRSRAVRPFSSLLPSPSHLFPTNSPLPPSQTRLRHQKLRPLLQNNPRSLPPHFTRLDQTLPETPGALDRRGAAESGARAGAGGAEEGDGGDDGGV